MRIAPTIRNMDSDALQLLIKMPYRVYRTMKQNGFDFWDACSEGDLAGRVCMTSLLQKVR